MIACGPSTEWVETRAAWGLAGHHASYKTGAPDSQKLRSRERSRHRTFGLCPYPEWLFANTHEHRHIHMNVLLPYFRLTCTLWGKVTSAALQCWTRPRASSWAFKWSAQEKGWWEVTRSRVLILQSAGNSAPSEAVPSDSERDICWLLENKEHKNYNFKNILLIQKSSYLTLDN